MAEETLLGIAVSPKGPWLVLQCPLAVGVYAYARRHMRTPTRRAEGQTSHRAVAGSPYRAVGPRPPWEGSREGVKNHPLPGFSRIRWSGRGPFLAPTPLTGVIQPNCIPPGGPWGGGPLGGQLAGVLAGSPYRAVGPRPPWEGVPRGGQKPPTPGILQN